VKTNFDTVVIDKTEIIGREGLEISAFIAGVNSGAYGLPFCIQVRAWAGKFWFSKFFFVQANLDLEEMKRLRNELDNAISFCETACRAK
jgi:hypothetical protein